MIYVILLITLTFYILLNNNTLLSLYLFIYILLYIKLVLIVFFSKFLYNVYLFFSLKSIVIIKKTKFNKKQIRISLRFGYIKYKI